jgi:chemotaxis protein MotA
LMNFPIADIRQLVKVVARTYFFRLNTPAEEIDRVIEYANLARKEGLLSLESKLKEVDDAFFAKGIQLVIDGFPAETVRDIMDLEAEWQRQRHVTGKKMMEAVGAYAPAFGMIGTLMGLIIMLGNMDDPEAIGPGMAVALITTLYGAIVSNLICLPFADKLAFFSRQELEVREVILRGILAIQDGDNPRLLEQKLNTFLPAAQRVGKEAA